MSLFLTSHQCVCFTSIAFFCCILFYTLSSTQGPPPTQSNSSLVPRRVDDIVIRVMIIRATDGDQTFIVMRGFVFNVLGSLNFPAELLPLAWFEKLDSGGWEDYQPLQMTINFMRCGVQDRHPTHGATAPGTLPLTINLSRPIENARGICNFTFPNG